MSNIKIIERERLSILNKTLYGWHNISQKETKYFKPKNYNYQNIWFRRINLRVMKLFVFFSSKQLHRNCHCFIREIQYIEFDSVSNFLRESVVLMKMNFNPRVGIHRVHGLASIDIIIFIWNLALIKILNDYDMNYNFTNCGLEYDICKSFQTFDKIYKHRITKIRNLTCVFCWSLNCFALCKMN